MVIRAFEVKLFMIVWFTLALHACHALSCFIMTQWFPIRLGTLQSVIDEAKDAVAYVTRLAMTVGKAGSDG